MSQSRLTAALIACLAGLVPGCAADTAAGTGPEATDVVHERCSLDPKAIVFGYTDGNSYFTAEVQAEPRAELAPVEAIAEISWTLLDGAEGKLRTSLSMGGSSLGPSTLEIPMVGLGTYTVEVQAAGGGCEPFRKSLTILSVDEPAAARVVAPLECYPGIVVNGSNNSDTLNGGPDDDSLFGNDGGDELHGNGCHDMLIGGRGNDDLFGGDGDDHIDGGSDTIFGGDCCVGGPGNDLFFNCEQIGGPC